MSATLGGAHRLTSALETAIAASRPALVAFVTGGFPTPSSCGELLRAVADAGVDAIEVGIPFSDPLADGPTIQRTSQIALEAGARAANVIALIRELRRTSRVPIVVMTYVNPVLKFGPDRFAAALEDAGVEGVLVTDLPEGELPELWAVLRSRGLATVPLVAPTTTRTRIPRVVERASGFVYVVSRTGVTGKGSAFAPNLADQIAGVRAATPLPVLVGFGVRTAADVESVRSLADGVVVGAALLERVLAETDPAAGRSAAARFLRELRAGPGGAPTS